MAKVSFRECGKEVYTLMHELINEYHLDLRNVKIKCLFYDKPRKHGDKVILGTAEVVSPKFNYLTDIDFIISIFEGAWDIMAELEKKALIDHELSHCFVGEDKQGNPVYKIIPHNVEDFVEILNRYGADWASNIYIEEDDIEEDVN